MIAIYLLLTELESYFYFKITHLRLTITNITQHLAANEIKTNGRGIMGMNFVLGPMACRKIILIELRIDTSGGGVNFGALFQSMDKLFPKAIQYVVG